MIVSARNIIAAAAIVAAAVLIVWVYGAFDPAVAGWFPRCLFNAATGLDCPGCGSQRALHALVRGDIAAAWRANAAFVIAVPLIAFVIVGKRIPRLRPLVNSQAFILTIFAATLAWWVGRNIFL